MEASRQEVGDTPDHGRTSYCETSKQGVSSENVANVGLQALSKSNMDRQRESDAADDTGWSEWPPQLMGNTSYGRLK